MGKKKRLKSDRCNGSFKRKEEREMTFKCPCCGNESNTSVGVDALKEIGGGATSRALMLALCDANGRNLSIDQLVDATYGGRIDGGPENARRSVLVTLHKLRKRVKKLGWQIPNAVKEGMRGSYRLIPLESTK